MVVQSAINHRFINLVGSLCIRQTRKKIVNVTPTEISLHRDRGFFHAVGSDAVIVISSFSSYYFYKTLRSNTRVAKNKNILQASKDLFRAN